MAFARYITIEVRLFDLPHIHNLHIDIDKVWIENNRPDIDTTSGTISFGNHESLIQDNQRLHSIERIHEPSSSALQ